MMNRWVPLILVLSLLGFGWWLWQFPDEFAEFMQPHGRAGEILTLQKQVNPDDLIKTHREKLFTSPNAELLESRLEYFPYLWMDVVYPTEEKGRDGILIWGMNEGEIILDPITWESTEGLGETVRTSTSTTDYQILKALDALNGKGSREEIQNSLKIAEPLLNEWLQNAADKKLITEQGGVYSLAHPLTKLSRLPALNTAEPTLTKSYSHTVEAQEHYTKEELIDASKKIFGNGFKVVRARTLYLPVYHIDVKNPDSSIKQTSWNAITGQEFFPAAG